MAITGKTLAFVDVGRNTLGLYSTPKECILSLIDWWKLPKNNLIYEPCAGNNAIVDELINLVYIIKGSMDIDPQKPSITKDNFLNQTKNNLDLTDCTIITNPPFKLFKEFVEKGFELGVKNQAYLIKTNTFSALNRFNFFKNYTPTYKLDLTWRPDFLNKGAPTMDCCWIIWEKPNSEFCKYDLLKKVKV